MEKTSECLKLYGLYRRYISRFHLRDSGLWSCNCREYRCLVIETDAIVHVL